VQVDNMRRADPVQVVLLAGMAIVFGLLACLSGRLTGSPTRIGTYTVEGLPVIILGAALVLVGLLAICSVVKDFLDKM
jgi:nitrate reductase gamma subunit